MIAFLRSDGPTPGDLCAVLGDALEDRGIHRGWADRIYQRDEARRRTGLDLVWVPAPEQGWFWMGATRDPTLPDPDAFPASIEAHVARQGASTEPTTRAETLEAPLHPCYDPHAFADEGPPHRRAMTEGFWMTRTPITNAQWQRSGRLIPYTEDDTYTRPLQPVVGVTWHEARAYAAWVNEALSELGIALDLPTEAQWEYAARGTDARRYPWGNEPPTPERAVFDATNEDDGPPDVGTRPLGASWCGLLDMAGTVWEWCLDPWRERYDVGGDAPFGDASAEARGIPDPTRSGRLSASVAQPPFPTTTGSDSAGQGGVDPFLSAGVRGSGTPAGSVQSLASTTLPRSDATMSDSVSVVVDATRRSLRGCPPSDHPSANRVALRNPYPVGASHNFSASVGFRLCGQ